MRHEVRTIPPAPRTIRWRPLFAHRWLQFACGSAFVVIGSLVAWLMFLQSGGKMSMGPRLDRGPVAKVPGVLRKVDVPRHWEGRDWQDVRYDFSYQNANLRGGCHVPKGAWQPGDEVTVEVLIEDPNASRIPGGVLHLDRDWLRAKFWIVTLTLPGGLLLLGWLASVFQLRRVLVYGDVSIGVVHRVRPVRFVLPEMLRVDYTFRDHHAAIRHNHHWVRAHGELGRRLLQQQRDNRYEEMPVLHDRALPQWNRMLLPLDFLPSPPPATSAPDHLVPPS